MGLFANIVCDCPKCGSADSYDYTAASTNAAGEGWVFTDTNTYCPDCHDCIQNQEPSPMTDRPIKSNGYPLFNTEHDDNFTPKLKRSIHVYLDTEIELDEDDFDEDEFDQDDFLDDWFAQEAHGEAHCTMQVSGWDRNKRMAELQNNSLLGLLLHISNTYSYRVDQWEELALREPGTEGATLINLLAATKSTVVQWLLDQEFTKVSRSSI